MQGIESLLYLDRCPTFVVYLRYTFFEINPTANAAQHFVTGAKHAVEQLKLLIQQFIDTHISRIAFIQKINHHDIELLPVAVAAPYSLFNALGIPRHVVIDDKGAELEVDAFGSRFGGNHDGSLVSEVIYNSCPPVRRGRTCDFGCTLVLVHPCTINGR